MNSNKKQANFRKKFSESLKQELFNYNKQDHIQLLDKKKSNQDFNKLHIYSLLQHSQVAWEIRYQYFRLVKSYYQNEITLYDFQEKFMERYVSVDECLSLLESKQVFFTPCENSLYFGLLIFDIESYCQNYSGQVDTDNSFNGVGSNEFKDLLNEIYQEMKEYLNEK